MGIRLREDEKRRIGDEQRCLSTGHVLSTFGLLGWRQSVMQCEYFDKYLIFLIFIIVNIWGILLCFSFLVNGTFYTFQLFLFNFTSTSSADALISISETKCSSANLTAKLAAKSIHGKPLCRDWVEVVLHHAIAAPRPALASNFHLEK